MSEGAYLLDKIRHKCIEDGDCLIWQGAYTSTGGRPRIYIGRKWLALRNLLWVEKNGQPKKGHRIGVSCGTDGCIEHLVSRGRSAELKGIRRSVSTKAKIAASKRAKSAYTPEFIAMVRESPENHLVLAEKLGMHYQTISRIRNHDVWKDYTNPFAGLGARA
jgi:hypothetical protein